VMPPTASCPAPRALHRPLRLRRSRRLVVVHHDRGQRPPSSAASPSSAGVMVSKRAGLLGVNDV
jgi:hypothetical protein